MEIKGSDTLNGTLPKAPEISTQAANETHESLKSILSILENTLNSFLPILQQGNTAEALRDALHDDAKLPHKELSEAAARVVNVMGEIDKCLQPADLVLADHFLGFTDTKCLLAAVNLTIPDLLANGPMSLQEIAEASKAKPNRLSQVLRTLVANNIFKHDPKTNLYANNHVSTRLRSDHWMQWHNWVELYGTEFYDVARGIPATVREDTTRTAAQVNFATDEDMFTYFQRRGWTPRLHRTLGGGAKAMAPGILADYPWNEVADKSVVDIGGGGGGLIALLLREHPAMKGVLFDLSAVIGHASSLFAAPDGVYSDLAGRVELHTGDFLKEIIPSEVYTMKWVLHDWSDDNVVTILRNIRKAIVPGPSSRLIVLESIVDAKGRRAERLARYGDINMMMMANGQERTEYEWRNLVTEAGWSVKSISGLRNAWVKAIDLRPT